MYDSVGILGGTFNPIHNGHLMMARCAKEQINDLDQVVLLPNNLPAYKDSTSIVANEHRLHMLKLAIEDLDYASVSDLELMRGGITYTIDTLNEIHTLNPNLKIYFIIGADSLFSFTKWYRYEEILKQCTLVAAARACDANRMQQFADELIENLGYGSIIVLSNDTVDASSSQIRLDLSNGTVPYNVLPTKVASYIVEHKLYGLGV